MPMNVIKNMQWGICAIKSWRCSEKAVPGTSWRIQMLRDQTCVLPGL